MKLRTTKKAIKEDSYRILSVGYCQLQHVLRHFTPFAYSTGAYGWSCDYFDINGVIISDGYNPVSSVNMKSFNRDDVKNLMLLVDRVENDKRIKWENKNDKIKAVFSNWLEDLKA